MSKTHAPNLTAPWEMSCIDKPRTPLWQLMLTQQAAHLVWLEWIKSHGCENDGPFDQAMRRLYRQLFENEVFVSGMSNRGER